MIDPHAAFSNAIRNDIDKTDNAGDADTADLLTEISRALDKQLWFLKAHVQERIDKMRDGDGTGKRS